MPLAEVVFFKIIHMPRGGNITLNSVNCCPAIRFVLVNPTLFYASGDEISSVGSTCQLAVTNYWQNVR